MLSIFIIIPLLTVLILLFANGDRWVRWISAAGMSVQLVLSVILTVLYFRSAGNGFPVLFQFQQEWFSNLGISFFLGVDGIGVSMILLTAIVIFTGVLASWEVNYRVREFFISLILLATGAFGFFIALDLFLKFFFYELAVIPMYLLIGLWGSGNKEYSAMKLTLMLMGGSALLLVGILGLGFQGGASATPDFNLLNLAEKSIPKESQWLLFPLTFVGFGVLGALFPLHTWSPDGHSAAPTAASMLHAGVLMKLGGYGCLKVATYLMPEAAQELAWIFIILATIGIVYGAFATLMQTDLKYINAYSSVSHCALVIFGIAMLTHGAMSGAVLQMFSHGVMTALFFALIGMIYRRTKTRDIREMSGVMRYLPFLGVAYVIGGFCSLGLPGLSGFVAELTLFVGAFQEAGIFYRLVTVLAVSSIVVTAVYILRVVGKFLMGPPQDESYQKFHKATWYEKASVTVLIIGILAMGVSPFWISEIVWDSVLPVMERIE